MCVEPTLKLIDKLPEKQTKNANLFAILYTSLENNSNTPNQTGQNIHNSIDFVALISYCFFFLFPRSSSLCGLLKSGGYCLLSKTTLQCVTVSPSCICGSVICGSFQFRAYLEDDDQCVHKTNLKKLSI